VALCAYCGYRAVAAKVDREPNPGELVEMQPCKPAAIAKELPDKASTYGMLKHIARERGYGDGWAAHKFRAIYTVWPNYYRHAPLQMPTPELRAWVQSQNIRWAKSRNNPANQQREPPMLKITERPVRERTRCRNPRCGGALKGPTSNQNHAFCCKGFRLLLSQALRLL
jgi:hypothetical protein